MVFERNKLIKMGFSPLQQHLFSFLNIIKVASMKSILEIVKEFLNTTSSKTSSVNEKLREEIMTINDTIKKYNLEIVELIDEITCEKLFILINTGDNNSQKSLFYNESTTIFFSKIIKECVLSEEGSLSEMQCLNLNSESKIKKSEAQSILKQLIHDKWLVSTNNKISLGMRSIAELEQSIKQHYPNDVKSCPFCKLLVFQGYICQKCNLKTHFACLKKYVKLSKENCVCPSCKEIWNELPNHVTVEYSHEERNEFRSPTVPASKKRKR